MKLKLKVILLIIACIPFSTIALTPNTVVSKKTASKLDSLMKAGLRNKYYPGASLAVGDRDTVLFEKYYGWHDYSKKESVTREDIYDLASCTKIVATTLAIMKLYDEGLVRLDSRIGVLLPEFTHTQIAGLTLTELLTHTSGLGNIMLYSLLFTNQSGDKLISTVHSSEYPYYVDRAAYLCSFSVPDSSFICNHPQEGYRRAGEHCYINPAVDTLITNQIVQSFKPTRRGKYLYSDLNFHIIKMIVEKTTGTSMDCYVAEIYKRMGMESTGFRPLQWISEDRIIPTEDDLLMQRGLLRGYTHDEIAAVSDNVGGNAGLFSNISDLSLFCRMILGNGKINGQLIISQSTIKLFTSGTPTLGFVRMATPPALKDGFGHTGYTGTIIWMDPARDIFMVFLSNRVNPSRTNRGLIESSLRTKIWETIKAN